MATSFPTGTLWGSFTLVGGSFGLMTQGRIRGLVLAPGAGAGSDHSGLIAIGEAAEAIGIRVKRIDFPYRLAGRKRPDRPEVLAATIRDAAGAFARALEASQAELALGGRSMGGRICSMVVAEGLPAAALVLVSYPLHPPGRRDRPRTGHFGAIHVPCLFVSGTRDAFATPEELTTATAAIDAPVAHEWIEGGDHSLRGADARVADIVARWLSELGTVA